MKGHILKRDFYIGDTNMYLHIQLYTLLSVLAKITLYTIIMPYETSPGWPFLLERIEQTIMLGTVGPAPCE